MSAWSRACPADAIVTGVALSADICINDGGQSALGCRGDIRFLSIPVAVTVPVLCDLEWWTGLSAICSMAKEPTCMSYCKGKNQSGCQKLWADGWSRRFQGTHFLGLLIANCLQNLNRARWEAKGKGDQYPRFLLAPLVHCPYTSSLIWIDLVKVADMWHFRVNEMQQKQNLQPYFWLFEVVLSLKPFAAVAPTSLLCDHAC